MSRAQTILDKIIEQRHKDVEVAKSARSLDDLKAHLNDFSQIDFYQRLQGNRISIMAEVKRASPSKGDIAPNIDAAKQGFEYACSGATVISCLTEPKWFKGTLEDMSGIRRKIESLKNRPALLRKDFIIDEYQVYEARANGADTLLLIVAAFENQIEKLKSLLALSRSLHMEPLVEVNTSAEMTIALSIGSRVIGINNRNLHNFSVDMNTTASIVNSADMHLPKGTLLAALSGISTRQDVEVFEQLGVDAVLVGESLMRAADPATKMLQLQGLSDSPPLVKICGVKDVAMAKHAAVAGANFIGLVFAEGSKRKVSIEQAKEIVKALRGDNPKPLKIDLSTTAHTRSVSSTAFPQHLNVLAVRLRVAMRALGRPLIVGVFADQPAEEVQRIAKEAQLDIIQLSGKESPATVKQLTLPVWKALHVYPDSTESSLLHEAASFANPSLLGILLDTADAHARGGTGRAFDWSVAKTLSHDLSLVLAGGLNAENISSAVRSVWPFAVDVSSGVETGGEKDATKIEAFLKAAAATDEQKK